mmetsp:Transcript_100529/g.159018  ORF Transcript_100529/g.159018 Transcript_100529/m.159018 type:complete len:85 (+) Transcript_100529:1159-1413(+)
MPECKFWWKDGVQPMSGTQARGADERRRAVGASVAARRVRRTTRKTSQIRMNDYFVMRWTLKHLSLESTHTSKVLIWFDTIGSE